MIGCLGRRRYPGAASFTSGDENLFRGRTREVQALRSLVLAERLIIVYARSGTGKSSLINAGLKNWLWTHGLVPVPVRFNDRSVGTLAAIYEGVQAAIETYGIEVEDGERSTPRDYFATLQLWRGDLLLTPVLIFDQFEELFTLQTVEQRKLFVHALADMLREPTSPIKVLISLREDFLGELDELSYAVPQIFQNRFRLGPLLKAEALEAIVQPAGLDEPGFQTQPFTYEVSALQGVWNALSPETSRVSTANPSAEPFHLQVIAQQIEEMVAARPKPTPATTTTTLTPTATTVTWADIGGVDGLDSMLEDFYEAKLEELPGDAGDKEQVRRLCETGFVSAANRRLSLEREEIQRQFRVGVDVLDRLVDDRVLRKDARVGSHYYELTHDALVKPIAEARDWRAAIDDRINTFVRRGVRPSEFLAVLIVLAFAALVFCWLAIIEPSVYAGKRVLPSQGDIARIDTLISKQRTLKTLAEEAQKSEKGASRDQSRPRGETPPSVVAVPSSRSRGETVGKRTTHPAATPSLQSNKVGRRQGPKVLPGLSRTIRRIKSLEERRRVLTHVELPIVRLSSRASVVVTGVAALGALLVLATLLSIWWARHLSMARASGLQAELTNLIARRGSGVRSSRVVASELHRLQQAENSLRAKMPDSLGRSLAPTRAVDVLPLLAVTTLVAIAWRFGILGSDSYVLHRWNLPLLTLLWGSVVASTVVALMYALDQAPRNGCVPSPSKPR